uniref:WGS project CBMI000000000 data, contig CS3069_c001280 n=1 Tax=Fusarium clavum TaxID=2594811 RepID=A0A090MFQ2_9HYPO|nr:unnamed protein product [Fusarium clavum]
MSRSRPSLGISPHRHWLEPGLPRLCIPPNYVEFLVTCLASNTKRIELHQSDVDDHKKKESVGQLGSLKWNAISQFCKEPHQSSACLRLDQ